MLKSVIQLSVYLTMSRRSTYHYKVYMIFTQVISIMCKYAKSEIFIIILGNNKKYFFMQLRFFGLVYKTYKKRVENENQKVKGSGK